MVTLAKLRPKPVKTVNAGFPYVNHKKSGRLSFESYSHSPPTISPSAFISNSAGGWRNRLRLVLDTGGILFLEIN
ncbi:hypothetical protein PPTG_22705 [Phytophthora nicotianae INRA-310]|uniref:Uncharacterized protein n=1 Tax=Phytophthora nicotianae (strain INRA-310) TaxID=761204 RepID=W2QE87_PHYN3|nr:hypothetical protein PPTG_22705 [Phytophthora nicotianae INRA-310]ETN10814.1 hypothetical protein PPTG_22705 [Phytophthora nicotianae INRA-310]